MTSNQQPATSNQQPATSNQPPYRAFLVRCWRAGDERLVGDAEWRVSIEPVDGGPGRKRGFTDFEELAAFLQGQVRDGDTDEK